MDNNVDEKYVIVVTYAVSNEEHDGYCSGNDAIDRVKLKTKHRYHEVGCVGRKNPSDRPGTCPGRSYIENGGLSRRDYCCKKYDYVKEYERGKKDTWAKVGGEHDQDKYVAIQLSDFHSKNDDVPQIDKEEIIVLLHNKDHCRAKITDRKFSNYKIDEGYTYCGKFTDCKRLEELYSFDDGCKRGSNYCCNNQGSHYIPLHAILIKKS